MRFLLIFLYFSIIFSQEEENSISQLFTSKVNGNVFYNAETPGKCYGSDLPSWVNTHGLVTAAINAGDTEEEACGMCVFITGQGLTPFTAFIYDTAPGTPTDLTLSSPGDGHSPITWQAIPCPTDTPLSYLFQTTNLPKQPIKLKIIGSKFPIQSLEFQLPNSPWTPAPRSPDNYFELNSIKPLSFPLSLKITSINGEQISDQLNSISSDNNNLITGNTQFTSNGIKSNGNSDALISDSVAGTVPNNELNVDEDSTPSNDTIMFIGIGIGCLALVVLGIGILMMVRKIRKRRSRLSQLA